MIEKNTFKKIEEKTILVGLITRDTNKEKANEYLDELSFLVETAGGIPVTRFVQALDSPNPKPLSGQENWKKSKLTSKLQK